tara:strand:+ start:5669 stop:6511 length:843 start_codon:yes stop_codon:yes gene_type:complete
MNCSEVISKAVYILKENLIKNPYLDSEMLLSKALKIKRENLLTNLNMKLKNKDIIKFNKLIERRRKKEPIAYILGYKSFWKSNFKVNQDVLIPRPETEHVIEEVLKIIPKSASYNILDVGTGSGCLIVSIILERQRSRGTAIDISKNAINIAKYNAKIQHIENRIKFVNSNIDKFNRGKYDLITSNPPYIKKLKIKYLEDDVKLYEPKVALDGGIDGYSNLKKVIKKSSKLLKTKGKLILEIDDKQKNITNKILKQNGFYTNKIVKDLAKKYRCIVSTKI